jgi:acyl-coenzyme A thioesterase PaaI-like protein
MTFDPAAEGWVIDDRDPFTLTGGPIWTRCEAGRWRYGVLAEGRHLNKLGIVHGGLPLLLADHALGDSLMRRLQPLGGSCVTVDVQVQFVGAINPGEFVEAHTEIVQETRSLAFIRGTLAVGERLTHTAHGVWKVRR